MLYAKIKVFDMYLWIEDMESYFEKAIFPCGRHSYEKTLGLAIFSYFLKSADEPSISPVKTRTILDFLRS